MAAPAPKKDGFKAFIAKKQAEKQSVVDKKKGALKAAARAEMARKPS